MMTHFILSAQQNQRVGLFLEAHGILEISSLKDIHEDES